MTEIYNQIIDHPGAWTNRSIGGKAGLVYKLEEKHLKAVEELLKKTRHLAPQEVTRQDFDHPDLNPMLADVFDILLNGRGAVIIQGVTKERFAREDFERIYWGFGTHWGVGVTQSALGDKLGRVTFTPVGPGNPTNRAYRGNQELTLHTDTNEIVGLMCEEKAAEGGFSQLASVLAVHNEIFKTRPDLLPALYRGHEYAINEASLSSKPVTPYKIPVFSCVDGKVSMLYVDSQIRKAAEKMGETFPADLDEAMKYLNEVAAREDIQINYMIEPGEIMVVNNFITMHARTEFKDSATQKRSLLRMWLDVPHGRPVCEAYKAKAKYYAGLFPGKDARADAVVAGS